MKDIEATSCALFLSDKGKSSLIRQVFLCRANIVCASKVTCNEKKTRNNKDYRENQSKVEMDRKKSLEMGPRTGKVKVVKVQVNNTVGRGLSRMGDRCVTIEPFQNR